VLFFVFHYLIFFFVISHVSDVSADQDVSGSVNFYFNDQSTEDMLSNDGVMSPDNPSGNNYFINVDYSYVDSDVTNNQQTEFNNSSISSSDGGYVSLGSLSNSMGQESGGTGVFRPSSNLSWFQSS
jgi:hypothetical protein